MKKLLYTLLLLMAVCSVKAEYNMWIMKVSIEQTDGKKLIAYTYLYPAYVTEDSLQFSPYLINALDGADHKKDNTIEFYKDKITYTYKDPNQKETSSWYATATPLRIKKSALKKVTILEKEDIGYITAIRNNLKLSDTVWMKTKVVKRAEVSGYLCSYDIFFHEYNPELEALLKTLKAQAKKAADKENDEFIKEDVLDKISKYKVIIIVTCTC